MATREECGDDYPLSLETRTVTGDRHVFDSFKCVVHPLAPVCERCGYRILGRGMDVDGHVFYCASCARTSSPASAARAAASGGAG